MKKISIGIIISAVFLLTAVCADAFVLGVYGKYEMGQDLYGYASLAGSSVSGQITSNVAPSNYLSAHIILGDPKNMFDLGVGMAESGTIPVSIGSIYQYFKITEMFKFYGAGSITYFLNEPSDWHVLTLKSTLIGLEVAMPVLPLSVFVEGGLRIPLVFGPNSVFAAAAGWNVEAGGRFYILK